MKSDTVFIFFPSICHEGFPPSQLIKNPPAMPETWVQSLGWEVSPEEGKGYPLQYSGLENSMDRGAWHTTVHGHKELDMTEQLSLSLLV